MFLIFLLIILLILLGLVVLDRLFKDEDFEKIPGPKGVFLFGNAFEFPPNPAEAAQHLQVLRSKYKDFYKVKFGPLKVAIILNPQDVEVLLSDTKFNTKGLAFFFIRPWLKDSLLISDGAKWHQRRKLLTPAFHFNILRHFKSIIIEKSKSLVKRLESELDKPKTGIQSYMSDFSLHSLCETAMGIALDKEEAEVARKYKSAVNKLGSYIFYRFQKVWLYPNIVFNLTTVGRDQKSLLSRLNSFRNSVINRRIEGGYNIKSFTEDEKEENEDDVFLSKKKRLAMLDLLLEAEKEGKIDREGIYEEVDSFIFAGYESTSISLQYALMLLANHQEAQDKIVEEYHQIMCSSDEAPSLTHLSQMKYLEACIKETLRLFPPAQYLNRRSDQSVQFSKYKCPPGTNYIIPIADLHRRSDQFEEPLKFKPERFLKEPTWHPFAYIPFSAGPRNCIGQKFAMLEMKLAISTIVREYRLLPVTKPDDIVIYMDIVLRSTEPVYVKFEKRNKAKF